MTSNEIFEAIEIIAANPSKKEKERLLKLAGKDADFRRVLVAALDPSVTYGIAKVPESRPDHRGNTFWRQTWQMLNDLASRQLTGNEALDTVRGELYYLSGASAELLKRIITKDLRAGFSASTVNKAIPGLIPTFPYMRCALPKEADLDAFPWDLGVFSQEKADGEFSNLSIDGVSIALASRQGSRFPMDQFAGIVEEARHMERDTQTHGELLVRDADNNILAREISNGILNSVLQGGSFLRGHSPVYLAWDQIPLSAVQEKGRYVVPYEDRWAGLQEQIGTAGSHIALIPTRIVHSLDEAYDHYRELLALRREGTIVKSPAGPWMDGTSKFQVKLKLEAECDLEITGFNPGEGKNATTFGSIEGKTSDRLLEVSVSGMSDKVRKEIHEQQPIGSIMTVRANSVMTPTNGGLHSLFLPRFVEIRRDKTEADSLQRVKDQFEAAVKAT